jgi:hypothetical protein
MQRTMRTHLVVVLTPQLEFFTDIGQREEYLHIQTLVAQPAVERFNIAIFRRFARPNEIQLYAILKFSDDESATGVPLPSFGQRLIPSGGVLRAHFPGVILDAETWHSRARASG